MNFLPLYVLLHSKCVYRENSHVGKVYIAESFFLSFETLFTCLNKNFNRRLCYKNLKIEYFGIVAEIKSIWNNFWMSVNLLSG